MANREMILCPFCVEGYPVEGFGENKFDFNDPGASPILWCPQCDAKFDEDSAFKEGYRKSRSFLQYKELREDEKDIEIECPFCSEDHIIDYEENELICDCGAFIVPSEKQALKIINNTDVWRDVIIENE